MAQRRPEQRPLQQRPVVLQGDEAQVAYIRQRVEIVIGDREDERRDHRQQEEQAEDDQRGCDEQPGGAGRVHGVALWPWSSIQRRFSRRRSARRSTSAAASSVGGARWA